jgi:hypothetical protein
MAERIDNPKARKNRLICRSSRVPEGWVVVGEHHSPACDGDGANALVVKLPGRREVVVEESPIPDGYRRVKRAVLDTGQGKASGWLIEREED